MKKSEFIQKAIGSLTVIVKKGVLQHLLTTNGGNNCTTAVIAEAINHSQAVSKGAWKSATFKGIFGDMVNEGFSSFQNAPATVENMEMLKSQLKKFFGEVYDQMDFPIVMEDGCYKISDIQNQLLKLVNANGFDMHIKTI